MALCDDDLRTPTSSAFVRRGPSLSERLEYLENVLTYNHKKMYRDIHTDLLYISTWYDGTNYFQSEVIARKKRLKPADDFRPIVTGAAFCLAQAIGGHLVTILMN